MTSENATTVAARISKKLKEAIEELARKLGLTASKLGRVAVRLYLRYPTTMANYELARLAEKLFPKQSLNSYACEEVCL